MARKPIYPTILVQGFDNLVAEGGHVRFVVAENREASLGYVYHVIITAPDGVKYMLARNKGQETYAYEIKSEISKTVFARKRGVQSTSTDTPDPEKYPDIQ